MRTHERCIASVHALGENVDQAIVQRLFVAVSRYHLSVQQPLIERLSALGVVEEIRRGLGDQVPADVEHHLDQIRASLLVCQTCDVNSELAQSSLGPQGFSEPTA